MSKQVEKFDRLAVKAMATDLWRKVKQVDRMGPGRVRLTLCTGETVSVRQVVEGVRVAAMNTFNDAVDFETVVETAERAMFLVNEILRKE